VRRLPSCPKLASWLAAHHPPADRQGTMYVLLLEKEDDRIYKNAIE
jgi:hypothetical protein